MNEVAGAGYLHTIIECEKSMFLDFMQKMVIGWNCDRICTQFTKCNIEIGVCGRAKRLSGDPSEHMCRTQSPQPAAGTDQKVLSSILHLFLARNQVGVWQGSLSVLVSLRHMWGSGLFVHWKLWKIGHRGLTSGWRTGETKDALHEPRSHCGLSQ